MLQDAQLYRGALAWVFSHKYSLVFFSDRRILLVLVLAFLLFLPVTFTPLSRDDFIHQAFMSGVDFQNPQSVVVPVTLSDAASHLFSFSGENGQYIRYAREWGNIPWWSDESLSINFWRPLSSASHWLDYQLWPDSPWLMHLHSIAWYLLLAFVFARVLVAQKLSGSALIVAFALYVLDSGHVLAVSWIANRNILLAVSFGLLCLYSLHQWRAQERIGHAVLFLIFLSCSLLSAEAGISTLSFIAAYLLVFEKGSFKVKAAIGALTLTWVLVWRIIYTQLGYGAYHSGLYLDPIRDFPAFFQSLIHNAPILMFDQMSGGETFFMLMSPQLQRVFLPLASVLLGVVFLMWVPLLRHNKVARFWFVVAMLSMIPASAMSLGNPRLMFFSGLGLMVVLALFLVGFLKNERWVPANKWYRFFAWPAVVMLGLSSLLCNLLGWGVTSYVALSDSKSSLNAYNQPFIMAESPQKRVLIVNPATVFELFYSPFLASSLEYPLPQGIHGLVPGVLPLTVHRVNQYQLEMSTETYFPLSPSVDIDPSVDAFHVVYLGNAADAIFMSAKTHYWPQQRIKLDAFEVTVISTRENGMPDRIRFEFPHGLEAADYQWLWWDWSDKQYKSWQLPSIGQSVTLAGPF